MELQTVYPFRLPKGYLDREGTLHREGRMRLATAGDELSAMRDPKGKADEGYLNLLLLSKVVLSLGALPEITPEILEGLFISDLEFLQNMYETVNKADHPQIQIVCPHCGRTRFFWFCRGRRPGRGETAWTRRGPPVPPAHFCGSSRKRAPAAR